MDELLKRIFDTIGMGKAEFISLPSTKANTRLRAAVMLCLYDKGFSVIEIATNLGISAERVRVAVKKIARKRDTLPVMLILDKLTSAIKEV